MSVINQRLAALRAELQRAGFDGLCLVCSDPHGSETVADHYQTIRHFCGFTGDSCTLVVTQSESALWTDGRYYVQADGELAGSEVASMHQGSAGVPEPWEYLLQRLQPGQRLAVDGSCISVQRAQALRKKLSAHNISVEHFTLPASLWPERPPRPATPCFVLSEQYAGLTAAQKLKKVRAALQERQATALAVTGLQSVGWLLNLRAADIECTPLAMAYCVVAPEECVLFIDQSRVPAEARHALEENGVTLADYDEATHWLRSWQRRGRIVTDPATTNDALLAAMLQNPLLEVAQEADPIVALKGVKNAVELENLRECHLRDGVAMVRFAMELERRLAAGEALDELDIAPLLRRLRGEQALFLGESFPTIAAWGPNAAMMHYHADESHHSAIQPHGFLLVDCGGQYLDGTTDITRTYAVGPLSEEEKQFYTWTLQSHIAMERAVWLDYCTGFALDTLAREPLWRHGINYRCGTGHGVGFVSGVHEGPQSLRPHNDVRFEAGMTITDEPGVYEEGLVGIRLENELECVDRGENQYGHWLAFRPLTWVPFDTAGILTEQLTADELSWLNEYHRAVYEKLAPRLTDEERRYLAQKTAPLG